MELKHRKSPKPIGIFTFTGTDNYGGCLQNYALSRQLEKLGHSCEQIFLYGSRRRESPFYQFRKRYFNLTEPVFSFQQCLQLNDRYNTVITGSDVVFQERNVAPEMGMLAWASGEKLLLSYAASFGEMVYNGNTSPEIITAMLDRFDAISVREEDGVKICEDLGIKATQVLDPSLLLTASEYENLINNFDGDLTVPEDYIFFYDAYGTSPTLVKAITEKFADKGETIITSACFGKSVLTPEQWLNFIKHAKYVITHSFHGLCFSLIFKKNFIQLQQSINNSRYDSLYNLFGIHKTGVPLESLTPDQIKKEGPIDYEAVYERWTQWKSKSIQFLTNSLAAKPTYKPKFIENLLTQKKICKYDPAGVCCINKVGLDEWVKKHRFNPAMNSYTRDILKLCTELKMETLFYAYETDNPEILKERELARDLLLGDAERTFSKEEFIKVSKNVLYMWDPHKLYADINTFKRESHKKLFKDRIKELADSKVYILFSSGNPERIFSYAKEYIKQLRIQSYLTFTGISASLKEEIDKAAIPVIDLFPFIHTAPSYPIIAFGAHTAYMQPLFKRLELKHEIIPCAFA